MEMELKRIQKAYDVMKEGDILLDNHATDYGMKVARTSLKKMANKFMDGKVDEDKFIKHYNDLMDKWLVK